MIFMKKVKSASEHNARKSWSPPPPRKTFASYCMRFGVIATVQYNLDLRKQESRHWHRGRRERELVANAVSPFKLFDVSVSSHKRL